ncbi:helix-turn-helix domain-containing protein [Streptomyces parvulus]|uniref:helix-turn-helix domain-containing protein n=1 Tax=Streptomyces parvulus TaxID=146923 RepID=UPI003814F3A6
MLRLDTDLVKNKAHGQGDVTHEDIAIRAGIDRSSVTRFFAGTVPTLPTVTALAWAYGIKLDDLVLKAATTVPPQVTA